MVLRIAALLGLLSVCARAALQAERGGFTEDDHHVLEVSQLGEVAGLDDRATDPNDDALAALQQVPDDIDCYHELVQKVKGIANRLADEKDRMHIEMLKFNHTSEVKDNSLHQVQQLEAEIVKQRAAMDESKESYKKGAHGCTEHLRAGPFVTQQV